MSQSHGHERFETAWRSAFPLARFLRRSLALRRGLHRLRLGSWRRLRLLLQLLRLLLVLLERRILRRRAEVRLLGLLLLDVIKRHADDCLLDLRALLRALLPGLLGLALLVLPAPVLRPRQLDRLDALAVKANHLVVEEELDLPIPLAEADPATGVDPVLRIRAKLSLDHHGRSSPRFRWLE